MVSGISFLGAGTIFKNGNVIMGLTTAAGIWATAAIGLAVGSGMYIVGIFTTVLVLGIQFVFHRLSLGGLTATPQEIQLVLEDDTQLCICLLYTSKGYRRQNRRVSAFSAGVFPL